MSDPIFEDNDAPELPSDFERRPRDPDDGPPPPWERGEAIVEARREAQRLLSTHPTLIAMRAHIRATAAQNRAEDRALWGPPSGMSVLDEILSW